MPQENKDYYKILQVDASADLEIIEVAYKRLARIYHPDINRSSDATHRMQEINAARQILRDPVKRAKYDRERYASSSRSNTMYEEERRKREAAEAAARRAQAEAEAAQRCAAEERRKRAEAEMALRRAAEERQRREQTEAKQRPAAEERQQRRQSADKEQEHKNTTKTAFTSRATYQASRLSFRADVIEPLAPSDHFRVVTPVGTFQMSKADFERTFANVVGSRSYRERGLYNYPIVPEKAFPFRVG